MASSQLMQEIEQSVLKASEKNPLHDLEQAKQIRLESEQKMRLIIQTRQEEIRELQNEADMLQLKESTLSSNYKALNEEYILSEAELQQQSALQTIELDAIDKLKEEIQQLTVELDTLEAPESSPSAIPTNELRLGLYRGLGVAAKVMNNTVDTIILTTADKQDIRTMGLEYDPEYLSNQCWDFLSAEH